MRLGSPPPAVTRIVAVYLDGDPLNNLLDGLATRGDLDGE